jgi:hypothetical protein
LIDQEISRIRFSIGIPGNDFDTFWRALRSAVESLPIFHSRGNDIDPASNPGLDDFRFVWPGRDRSGPSQSTFAPSSLAASSAPLAAGNKVGVAFAFRHQRDGYLLSLSFRRFRGGLAGWSFDLLQPPIKSSPKSHYGTKCFHGASLKQGTGRANRIAIFDFGSHPESCSKVIDTALQKDIQPALRSGEKILYKRWLPKTSI